MILEFLQGILNTVIEVFFAVWWVVIPLALLFIFWNRWLYYIYTDYLRRQKWVLLEVKIPQLIEKTPKAMEQIFAAFYQIYSFGLKFMERYWHGKLQEDFISCEIVGHAGAINFYIRTPTQYRNLVESAIYAQYPDAEIHEAEDYRLLWPKTLPNKLYDIAGSDYQLIKEDAYPIRTHEYFFAAAKEEQHIDPIAAIVEVMSRLKEDEALWLQIFVRPVANEWKKAGEEIVAELAGRSKGAPPKGLFDHLWQFMRNLIIAPIEHPVWPEEKKKEEGSRMLLLTPGERNVIEGIERKISKIGFETNIRFIYIDRRDAFTPMNVAAIMSAFNQFTMLNMNGFMPKIKTFTLTPAGYKGLIGFLVTNFKFLKRRIIWYRKRHLWDDYMKLRWSRGRRSILNIEELATLFHFPGQGVEAPLLRRLGAKKGEPPAGLPFK